MNKSKRNCPDCGAKPDELHKSGCDVERCALCGGQLISCPCVYEVNGMNTNTLKQDHPTIYNEGATGDMWVKYETEVAKVGGSLPWEGEWPGTAQCIEFGWYSKFVAGQGWQKCTAEDPEASPDFNRLAVAQWSREKRRFVRPE
jgi:hypothetical protein